MTAKEKREALNKLEYDRLKKIRETFTPEQAVRIRKGWAGVIGALQNATEYANEGLFIMETVLETFKIISKIEEHEAEKITPPNDPSSN